MIINKDENRYVFDPLYKVIYLPDFIWDILSSPEIQRLREVRLCNINSYSLTGCANINRYEHAIGTLFLAQQCLENWPPLIGLPNKTDQKLFLLAALLHDIISAPFGHSIEYIESKEGFQHESAFEFVITGDISAQQYNYQLTSRDPFFFGLPRNLLKKIRDELKLSTDDIKKIGYYISGQENFGPLINGTIDLDNIDNVYRMAYHIGLFESGKSPLELAQSMYVRKNKLIIKKESISLVQEWHEIRKKLYKFLLLNPEEFSAKCMLTEAIELNKISSSDEPIIWNVTDFELLTKLHQNRKKLDIQRDNPEALPVQDIITRLVTGNLYGCVCILSSREVDAYDKFTNFNSKSKMEREINQLISPDSSILIENFSKENKISIQGIKGIYYDEETNKLKISIDLNEKSMNNLILGPLKEYRYEITNLYSSMREKFKKFKVKNPKIALHSIKDRNKTERQITIEQDDGNVVTIGNRSEELLIGVFLRNSEWNMYKIEKLDKNPTILREIHNYFVKELQDPTLKIIDKYGEKKYV
jgi:hypothetical protein